MMARAGWHRQSEYRTRALQYQLQVAGAVGGGIRQSDRKKPSATLTDSPASGVPRACWLNFTSTPRHVCDPAAADVRGYLDPQIDLVTRLQGRIKIAPDRYRHPHPPRWNVDVAFAVSSSGLPGH